MPVMDGIEFYKDAAESDSSLKKRFLFYTSTNSRDHLHFFIDNDVPFIFKPAAIRDIENAVEEIFRRSGNRRDEGNRINDAGRGA